MSLFPARATNGGGYVQILISVVFAGRVQQTTDSVAATRLSFAVRSGDGASLLSLCVLCEIASLKTTRPFNLLVKLLPHFRLSLKNFVHGHSFKLSLSSLTRPLSPTLDSLALSASASSLLLPNFVRFCILDFRGFIFRQFQRRIRFGTFLRFPGCSLTVV